MKTKNLLIPITILTAVILITISCKKDRIEPAEDAEDPLNEYNSVNQYLDTKHIRLDELSGIYLYKRIKQNF